jgi:hypothetical protein
VKDRILLRQGAEQQRGGVITRDSLIICNRKPNRISFMKTRPVFTKKSKINLNKIEHTKTINQSIFLI